MSTTFCYENFFLFLEHLKMFFISPDHTNVRYYTAHIVHLFYLVRPDRQNWKLLVYANYVQNVFMLSPYENRGCIYIFSQIYHQSTRVLSSISLILPCFRFDYNSFLFSPHFIRQFFRKNTLLSFNFYFSTYLY